MEYDLDTSGGLMNQVQALIAPPSEDGKEKSKRLLQHPYFKRPGRGHNHDCCDACGEGGDLICCDKCPASFHLQCHDPPLEHTDIPLGEWVCHSCKYTKYSGSVPRQTRSKRSTCISTKQKFSKKKLNPMQMLIEAAKSMNPKQFELPRSMSVPIIFPGTDKVESTQFKKQWKGIKDYEKTSNGLVPLPAKKCYECRKSCRVAPLIACDYCCFYFHLDCLDPPLTAPPGGNWMCPMHVEHALDTKLLKSLSVTERIKLWDQFGGYVDQDAVKLEFFRKVHCKYPPFHVKVKLDRRKAVQVPPMVYHHYKKPVSLLPSLKDVMRFNVWQESKEEQDEFEIDHDHIYTEQVCHVCKVQNNCICDENGHLMDNKNTGSNDRLCEIELKNNRSFLKQYYESNIKVEPFDEFDFHQLDDRLIKALAYQQILYLTNKGSKPGNVQNFSSHQKTRVMPGTSYHSMTNELLTPVDIEKITRAVNNSNSAIRPPKNKSVLRARAMLCPVVSKHFYNVRTSEVNPTEVRHDASYMGYRPTVSTRFPEAIAMKYRVLNIGKGSANHVDLDKFGHCNRISPKHAVLFFDEYTKHYELINYSQYGTYVNNIFYSNNLTLQRPKKPQTDSDGNTTERKMAVIVEEVRKIIDKKRKVSRSDTSIYAEKMIATEISENTDCFCNPEDLKSGWEGSAVLNHGTLLKFGCIPFVFSIVESVI